MKHVCSRPLVFRPQVGSAGYSVKLEEKERLRMNFSFLAFRGRVKLRNPDHKFQVRVLGLPPRPTPPRAVCGVLLGSVSHGRWMHVGANREESIFSTHIC